MPLLLADGFEVTEMAHDPSTLILAAIFRDVETPLWPEVLFYTYTCSTVARVWLLFVNSPNDC
jgi:hypothetical protein